jgi:transposase
MTHDYKRNGTASLFAALDLLDGTVCGVVNLRHRHQEFVEFLHKLDREYPKDLDLHLVLDNYGTHKHAAIKAWLAKRPRFHLHFIPTSSSWLNLVEAWFAQLTAKAIVRGSFGNVGQLITAINRFIEANNQTPNRSFGPPQSKPSWRRSTVVDLFLQHTTSGPRQDHLCCS